MKRTLSSQYWLANLITRLLSLLPLAVWLNTSRAAMTFDSFADATGSGGTGYAVGSYLFHQANALGNQWFALTNIPAPPAKGLPMIVAGNLSYPGLPGSRGNSVFIPAAGGCMGRLTLDFPANRGTVYFSFLLKVIDLSGVDESGRQNNFFAALGDNVGNQDAALVRAVSRIYTRRAGAGFNLGVARNSNRSADWVFDSTERSTNEVLFVVGSYNHTQHTASLWINPPASFFGSSTPPAPTVTATRGSDLNNRGVRSFVLGCYTNAPPGCLVDELRVGTEWSTVTGGPGIAVQPANRTQNAGASAVFTVKAEGGSLTYQWSKDGIQVADGGNISGANATTLTIGHVQQNDSGVYTVKVANAIGTVVSEGAVLNAHDPGIKSQPLSQVLPAGTSARFEVVAGGTPPLAYRWLKDGHELSDSVNIIGANSPTLTINNISAGDAGNYSVLIKNSLGNSTPSSNATLYLTSFAARPRRPNILFILCDDLGYGDLGVLFQNNRAPGLPRERTPNIDVLASQGLQLREHYCPAPICAPSRASLMLGMHQGHANVRDQQFDKALAENHTLASVLKTAGYATAIIGKWGLQGKESGNDPATWPAYPTKRGFDYFFGYVRHGDGHEHYPKEAVYSNHSKQCYDGVNNITPSLDKCYTTDLFTARAKKWITDQHAGHPEQPFFLYLAYDTPHAVHELPTQAYPSGGGLHGGMQWLGKPGHMITTASGTVNSFFHPDYALATYDKDHNPATPEVPWPEVFKRYATSVRRIDDAVGDLMKLLHDLALDTNTLVIFTSDNGPTIEDYLNINPHYAANFFENYGPMDGIKRDTWEGGIRMPTIACWTGTIAVGTTNETPSQFQDWMPTFADLAGLPAPAHTDGVSLVPTLLGIGKQSPSTIYVEYFDDGSATPEYPEFLPDHRGRLRNQMQVIRLGGYQGVRYDIKSHRDDFEIYDVAHDPKEATNLALNPSFAALQRQMKDRVLELRRPNASAPRPYDNEFIPSIAHVAMTNGMVNYAVYEGEWPWVPDVDMLSAASTGRVAGLDISIRPRETNYAVAYSGYINVPTDGDYTFYLRTDAGALFRIHDATVIDDDFTHTGNEVSANIRLKAGPHPFRLIYRHATGPTILDLKYSGPGIPEQAVPKSVFDAACTNIGVDVATQYSEEQKTLTGSNDLGQDLRNRLRPFLYA